MAAVAVNTHIMKIQRIIPKEAAYQIKQSVKKEVPNLYGEYQNQNDGLHLIVYLLLDAFYQIWYSNI